MDQNEEGPTDIPICLTDENVYSNKFSNFNQSYDDDDFQAETNHVGQPTFDWCYEFHHHQRESRNHPF